MMPMQSVIIKHGLLLGQNHTILHAIQRENYPAQVGMLGIYAFEVMIILLSQHICG